MPDDPLAGLGGGGPPAGGGGTTTSPIGIPQGYDPGMGVNQGKRPDAPSGHMQGTQYMPGDEWSPINMKPNDILKLQSDLVLAGILSKKQTRPGVWDNHSAEAYRTVLAYANAYGTTAHLALMQMKSNPSIAQTQGSTRQIAPTQLTNPIDIRAAVTGGGVGSENIAQRLTGKDLPTDEAAKFVQYYQDQERNARGAYNAADLANKGGAYTAAPSLDAAAQDYIKQNNLNDTVAYGTAARMLQFFDMLKAPT